MTEFELIDLFTRGAPRAGEGVLLGIGDDAALLSPPRGEDLVMTVDAVVEGVHFDGAFRPADVGWKALAVNLSDLAAMGARPLWALCALSTPRPPSIARIAAVGRGLAACAREFGVALAGGNVTRARELALTVTAVGAVPRGRALRRSGARPGDVLLVSGTLGEAALGRLPAAPRELARRQRRPTPRLALGRALLGIARAAIDVSDGLLQDLGHLCDASGVAAALRRDALPLSAAYRRAAARLGLRQASGLRPRASGLGPRASRVFYDAALNGGEDYELLVAVPPADVGRAQAAARKVGVPLTAIGEASAGRGGVRVLDAAGRRVPVRAKGHDHLAE